MTTLLEFLVIDDDPDDIDFFMEALQEMDLSVKCRVVHDGVAGLEELNQNLNALPDFIFLDLNMPRMDGKTCLRKLKKDDRFKEIPVIIYTTSSNVRDRQECMELGASYFLAKPVSLEKLCDGIARVMATLGVPKMK